MRYQISALASTCAALALLASPASAQDQPQVYRGAETVEVVTPYVFTQDLKTLPAARAWKPGDPIKEIPRRLYPRPGQAAPSAPANPTTWKRDALLQTQADAPRGPALRAFSTPDINIAGQGFSGVTPPDTVGEVGANYYIQMINGSGGATFIIYDKTDGSAVAGPIALDSLGSGFCANGLGDPVALYDHLAGRWILSEFSSTGNRLCVYVSQSGDPVSGGWYNYDFQAPNFPDYPKYAVWPDAYYVSTNEGSTALYALERSQMLNGAAAANQRFTVSDLSGFGFQALTPGDLDGTPPPAGAPNYFIRHRDDEVHNSGSNDPGQDFLDIFEFDVDFAVPANSSVTGPFSIGISEIDSSLCGLTSFSCFQQPGTSVRLDPLREVVMWRSQYRNFGTHQSLVGNLVTDVDGTDHGGVRWYELRNTGSGWTLFQEGTYAIDGDSRFMGSAAMDGSGNLAVGYNVSSSVTFPSLRYAGRLSSDALGTLPQGEYVLINGTGSNSSNRYGDYSALNLDPVDDCTFWFTGEYNAGSAWSTRIGAFRFDNCGTPMVCGNNVREGLEVCDGTDLGGATCTDSGCLGGTLACNASCTAFDTSACTACPACDFDNICEVGEDCAGCSDCVGGTVAGAQCGNGLCEAGDGEDCLSCPSDCAGRQNGKPANRYCCGDGDGQNPVGCGDSRCSTGGNQCTSVPQQPGSFCCGLFGCETGESCANCGLDCALGGEICSGGVDEDCDGLVDCADPDCDGDPACNLVCTLGQLGDSCSVNSDCCSNKCKGKQGQKTCR